MRRILLYLLFVAAAVLLLLGIVLPIVRLERLYFFSDEPSLILIVSGLWRDGNAGLAALVATFSIVFPTAKLVVLAAELRHGGGGLMRHVMPYLAKWSMMDVMLVAIVIFAAKTSGLANAVTLPGFWCYAVSAVIAAVLPSVVSMRGGTAT